MIDSSLVTIQGQIDTYIPQPEYTMPMYRAAVEWLKTKYSMKSQSEKTKKAYQDALQSFDAHIQSQGLRLDSEPREVALAAQEWVLSSKVPGRIVSSGTINQRYAIISSYYTFAIKYGACQYNPIAYCERPQRHVTNDAPALDSDYIEECMKRIDRNYREGKRDYTFLLLAFTTGRRSSELTGLQWKHCSVQGKKIVLTWARCKGGKVMHDTLEGMEARLLIQFLKSEYGQNLEKITPESYVFQSHSGNNQGGRITPTTASKICMDRLGFSQVHTTRHSFAVNLMEHTDATIADIGEQLGHSNLNTTSDYLKRKKRTAFKFAGKLSSMFGIDEK